MSRGRAFVFDRVGKECRLRCVNSETAKPIWESTYPTDYEDNFSSTPGPRSSPVVDEDRVYTFGPEGVLRCVNVVDGKEIWKIDTAEKFHVIQNFFGVGSTPVVEGDLLIVVIGGSPADSHPIAPDRLDQVKGNGSGIVAFDKRTGAVKYQITDELASYRQPDAGHDRRPAMVLRARPRRIGRVRAERGQNRFPISVASEGSV